MRTCGWFSLGVAIVALPLLKWHQDWRTAKPLSPRGGLPFYQRICLEVPHFYQGDSTWGDDLLGATAVTLGQEGCAVSCAAMVLAFYGAPLHPGTLNRFLQRLPGGYTPRGWIEWQCAAEAAPQMVNHLLPHYEDLPSYALIDSNLLIGNPVIVRVRSPRDTTHFMVLVGKEGDRYLTLDPGKSMPRALYFLDEYGSSIEALRFYRKPPANTGGTICSEAEPEIEERPSERLC